jgi:hypothetical protein
VRRLVSRRFVANKESPQLLGFAFGTLPRIGAKRSDGQCTGIIAEVKDRTIQRQAGSFVDLRTLH